MCSLEQASSRQTQCIYIVFISKQRYFTRSASQHKAHFFQEGVQYFVPMSELQAKNSLDSSNQLKKSSAVKYSSTTANQAQKKKGICRLNPNFHGFTIGFSCYQRILMIYKLALVLNGLSECLHMKSGHLQRTIGGVVHIV